MNADHACPVHYDDGAVFLRAGQDVLIRAGQARHAVATVVGPGRRPDTIRVRVHRRGGMSRAKTIPASDLRGVTDRFSSTHRSRVRHAR